MAISISSRHFQFHHGNFNSVTAISTSSRQFQFHHRNFNLVTATSTSFVAISISSRQFQFYHGNFFSTCLRTQNSRLGFWRPITITIRWSTLFVAGRFVEVNFDQTLKRCLVDTIISQQFCTWLFLIPGDQTPLHFCEGYTASASS